MVGAQREAPPTANGSVNRRRRRLWFAALILASQVPSGHPANWAQSSGDFAQNVVFPYIPSPSNRHWQGRFGHATVMAKDPDAPQDQANLGRVYLLGGDTNDGDKSVRPFKAGLLDLQWNNGYKNDVWRMKGTDWVMKGDMRIRTKYRQKTPRVVSRIQWEQVGSPKAPPPGVTYDDWIICQAYFASGGRFATRRAALCPNGINEAMWSPRRHHSAVYFQGTDGRWAIYVLGGRAREFVALGPERSVGGVQQNIQPRVVEAQVGQALSTTQREAIVYKSDIWRSFDGDSWELVTPGCQAPQADMINKGNPNGQGEGHANKQCNNDNDCYGAEMCDFTKSKKGQGTCVCQMWSSREQHSVVVHNGFMYLSGGFASYLYDYTSECGEFGCGDTDASAYRYYLNDVWYSPDGLSWTPLTSKALSYTGGAQTSYYPRGGHSMMTFDPPPAYPLAFASDCEARLPQRDPPNDACALGNVSRPVLTPVLSCPVLSSFCSALLFSTHVSIRDTHSPHISSPLPTTLLSPLSSLLSPLLSCPRPSPCPSFSFSTRTLHRTPATCRNSGSSLDAAAKMTSTASAPLSPPTPACTTTTIYGSPAPPTPPERAWAVRGTGSEKVMMGLTQREPWPRVHGSMDDWDKQQR